MDASQRITALAANFHVSIKAMSQLCGYERPQAFYDIQKGKTRSISPTMCDRILAVFPDVNRVWLLTGDGPMLSAQDDEPQPDATVKMVPLVHVSALAGPLSAYYEEGEDYSRASCIVSPTPLADIAVPVSGDSMEPVFPNGSTVYLRRINESAFIPWGQPMVIDTENGVYLKNLVPDQADDSYLWAESINPRYPRMHVPKASVRAIYRVMAVLNTFSAM